MQKRTRIGVYGIALKGSDILLVTKEEGCYKGKLDLPGGGIEFGESPEQALRREFLEEVHLAFNDMILLENLSHVREVYLDNQEPFIFHHLGQLYYVKDYQPAFYSEKADPHAWYPVDQLLADQLTPFAAIALEKAQSSLLLF